MLSGEDQMQFTPLLSYSKCTHKEFNPPNFLFVSNEKGVGWQGMTHELNLSDHQRILDLSTAMEMVTFLPRGDKIRILPKFKPP